MEFRVTNGSTETLTGLDIQMCVMLKGLNGFELQSNDNKIFQPPFAAARDASGRRWIITALGRLQACLGQPALPLPSFRSSCPGLPAGRVEKRQRVGVVL